MASGLSLVLRKMRFKSKTSIWNSSEKGARVSGKDRSLHGKARVKARRARQGW